MDYGSRIGVTDIMSRWSVVVMVKIKLINQDSSIAGGDVFNLLFPFGFDLLPYWNASFCGFLIPIFKDMKELELALPIPDFRGRIPNQSRVPKKRHELVFHTIPSRDAEFHFIFCFEGLNGNVH